MNDTIVVFDRVRENQRLMRREPLDEIVNTSVNQTLGRTIITSGATFLAVLALYLFGGEVLRGFAFTMIVGVVTRHLLDGVHRRDDRDHPERPQVGAGRAAVPVEEAVERPRKGGGRNVRVS